MSCNQALFYPSNPIISDTRGDDECLENKIENKRDHYKNLLTMLGKQCDEKLSFLPDKLHLGIIMDGNRRWGKINHLPGHFFGCQKTEEVLQWFFKIQNIQELTLYCLSIDNLNKRDNHEIQSLERLLQIYLSKLQMQNQFKIKVIGETHLLSQETQRIIKFVEDNQPHNDCIMSKVQTKTLNLAIAYDPLNDPIGKLLGKDIDYVIRFGNVMRTSGFFPLNTLYSEWLFLPILWPDINLKTFINCLIDLGKRERRYGL